MKILFLDIDGVVNCSTTGLDPNGFLGIDKYMAFLVGKIVMQTECKIVLSSSWKHGKEAKEQVKKQVYKFIDITPDCPGDRGNEIKAWLDDHPEVTKYAILDDDSDMLKEQLPSFFQTTWKTGLTDEIMYKVIKHLNS